MHERWSLLTVRNSASTVRYVIEHKHNCQYSGIAGSEVAISQAGVPPSPFSASSTRRLPGQIEIQSGNVEWSLFLTTSSSFDSPLVLSSIRSS